MYRAFLVATTLLALSACGRREGETPEAASAHREVHEGVALIQEGRIGDGLDRLRALPDAAVTARNIPAWHPHAVRALLEQGEIARADSLLALIGPVSEQPPEQRYLSAQVSMMRGHAEEALRRYAMVEGDPTLQAKAAFESAVIHSLRGQHQRAIDAARRALAVHAHDTSPRALVASSLIALDRPTLAMEEARQLPEGPPRWMLEAHALLALGSADSASVSLDRALAQSDDPLLRYLKGWALVEQARPEEALGYLQPLAERAYKDAPILAARALDSLGRGEEADALRTRHGSQAARDEARILWSQGLAKAQAREPADALPLLEAAAELDPGNPTLLNDLGAILTMLRRYEEAEVHFRAALEIRPDDASIWGNLAQLFELTGRTEEREDALRRMAEALQR